MSDILRLEAKDEEIFLVKEEEDMMSEEEELNQSDNDVGSVEMVSNSDEEIRNSGSQDDETGDMNIEKSHANENEHILHVDEKFRKEIKDFKKCENFDVSWDLKRIIGDYMHHDYKEVNDGMENLTKNHKYVSFVVHDERKTKYLETTRKNKHIKQIGVIFIEKFKTLQNANAMEKHMNLAKDMKKDSILITNDITEVFKLSGRIEPGVCVPETIENLCSRIVEC